MTPEHKAQLSKLSTENVIIRNALAPYQSGKMSLEDALFVCLLRFMQISQDRLDRIMEMKITERRST